MHPDFDFDSSLDRTIRVDVPIPLSAMPVDEDGPTLVLVPSAIAALVERSVAPPPLASASADALRTRDEDERTMRFAVFAIWGVAAALFATLGLLVH